MMVDDTSQQHGDSSFVTGFTLGLFAGAAGYYVFATDQGAKLRRKLVTEWDAAREHLAEEGVIDRPNVSLRELINSLLQKIFEVKSPVFPERPHRLIAKSNSGIKRKDTGKRFKGV